MYIFCKVNQHLSGEVHSRTLQYDGKNNDSEYNQSPTATKRKAPNICQALADSSKLCYLKLMWMVYDMAQVPSMPHRNFQLLVKIQLENGVQLVEVNLHIF